MSYLDLRDLAALLEDGGHADLVSLETWSRDAGAYYCNEMFYRTLHAIRELGAPAEDGSSLIPASFARACVLYYTPCFRSGFTVLFLFRMLARLFGLRNIYQP